MKVSAKLVALLLVALGSTMVVCAVLIAQLQSLQSGYAEVLAGPVAQAESARVGQVEFKKQVQEWKNILLRGHDPDDLEKYTRQFEAREASVRTIAEGLSTSVDDPDTQALVDQFLDEHTQLGDNYDEAYETFKEGNFDAKAADRMVRGQDRAPTDRFDSIVARLNEAERAQIEAREAATAQASRLVVIMGGIVLLVVGTLGLLLIRSISGRLRELNRVTRKLAAGDINGLDVAIDGSDELAELGEGLKGVHAAFETMLDEHPEAS